MVPYRLPFRKPYVTSRGRLDHREMVLLRIRGSSGVEGLGEAVPLSLRGGTEIETVVAELERWGDGATSGEAALPASSPARCAVSTALADLEAREAGVPLRRLLSPGSGPRTISCNATLSSGSPQEVAAEAEVWAADGFRTFKLKVGPGSGAEQVEAVRSVLGPDALIRIDANGTWDVNLAAGHLAELEPHGIELAEQPVSDLAGMALLRQGSPVPLVADESVSGPEQAEEAARLGACDAVTVKLSKTGSLDPSLGGYLPVYLSSALDGPVGIAAAAHVACTLPAAGPFADAAHGLATGRLFAASIAIEDPVLNGPSLTVPAGPGLGITIDEAALQRHRL